MNDYADLEISLDPIDTTHYKVKLQLSLPNSDAPVELVGKEPALAQFDFENLGDSAVSPYEYGQSLSDGLFNSKFVRDFFEQARVIAASHNAMLRIRLKIPRTASILHQLRWETLRDPRPDVDSFLFADERTPFSRYLTSDDPRPVLTRPREDLKALVVISNPTNLDNWNLAEINVADELKRAKAALGSIPVYALCRLDGSQKQLREIDILGVPTLNNLATHLHSRYDILYLICHGKLEEDLSDNGTRKVAKVWLENDHGAADVITSSEHVIANGERRAGLVDRIKQLPQLPRLIILGSCQSAGEAEEWVSTDGGALASLGPILVEAGVPAVIAMQGNVKMDTVMQFMDCFFEELLRVENEGQIDLAMAVARAKVVGHHSDWWVPTLFMRLRSGRIAWHQPGFRLSDGQQDFEKWPALIQAINLDLCTPILGPGLLDSLIGPVNEFARHWADSFNFPLFAYQRDDLPTVAQYVSIKEGRLYPYHNLGEYLRQKIQNHYRHVLDPDLQSKTDAPLDKVLDKVGKWFREQDPSEVHRVLSRLPFKIYITANPDNLLTSALEDPELDKVPHVEMCVWNEILEAAHIPYEGEPTFKAPLIYHLFGRLNRPRSMVLTQDDYFDYLIGVTRYRKLIPPVIRDAMTDSLLLFLGFQIDDWSFRALLRSIIQQKNLMDDYAHVAVQLDPTRDQVLEPEAARRYLEQYFNRTAISIYWGRTEDFVRELRDEWNKMYGSERCI